MATGIIEKIDDDPNGGKKGTISRDDAAGGIIPFEKKDTKDSAKGDGVKFVIVGEGDKQKAEKIEKITDVKGSDTLTRPESKKALEQFIREVNQESANAKTDVDHKVTDKK